MFTCVTDLAFGDTGKGKIVDAIAHEYDVCVRFNGGPNAGHTIVVDGQKYSFHNLPSAMFSDNPPETLVLAGGMVANPVSLAEEIKKYKQHIKNLIISPRIHCIMPWHIESDVKSAKDTIGTTGKGIGPCYADKALRVSAIRMGDLLKSQCYMAMTEVDTHLYKSAAEYLQQFICDERYYLRQKVNSKSNILFESANGIHLDVDHGTYPYVTSSGCGPAYIPQSCGLPNFKLDRIIGITKAYTTRVGKGELRTELLQGIDCVGESIRKIGNEYGTTTGRPRRVGWLDLDVVREGTYNTGATEVAITHMDTLALACAEHNLTHFYANVDGQGMKFPIWYATQIESNGYANDFLQFVESFLGLPVTFIGTGRDRKQLVQRQQDFFRVCP